LRTLRAHERDAVVANVGSLVEKARRERVPVVWVQHSDEQLARGSDDWRIVPELTPSDAEPLVEKNYGESFEDTTLETVLSDLSAQDRQLVAQHEDLQLLRARAATEQHHPARADGGRRCTPTTRRSRPPGREDRRYGAPAPETVDPPIEYVHPTRVQSTGTPHGRSSGAPPSCGLRRRRRQP
jgi:hypothetical protein